MLNWSSPCSFSVLLGLSVATIRVFVFFFNDTATTEIYTLSLHDALPICNTGDDSEFRPGWAHPGSSSSEWEEYRRVGERSEEHTSELQSRLHLVCRLLLEKKKKPDCRRSDSILL